MAYGTASACTVHYTCVTSRGGHLHAVAVGLSDVLVGVRLLVIVVRVLLLLAGSRDPAEARLVEGLDVALQDGRTDGRTDTHTHTLVTTSYEQEV